MLCTLQVSLSPVLPGCLLRLEWRSWGRGGEQRGNEEGQRTWGAAWGESSVMGGGCWSRERLARDGERNQGRNCSAQMVRSCGLRGGCCISTDYQTSETNLMIFKLVFLLLWPHLLIATSLDSLASFLASSTLSQLLLCLVCTSQICPCSLPSHLSQICSGGHLLPAVVLPLHFSPLILLLAPCFIDAVSAP